MKHKFSWAIFGILIAIAVVSAISYPEPFNSNVDANNYNLTSADVIEANIFEGIDLYINNIFGTNVWCYQNSTNISTSCGGVVTGTGNYTNSSTWINLTYAYDENFTTSAIYNGANTTTGFISMNYTKPANALNSSQWTVKRASAINNYSIDSKCWSQSSILSFRGVVQNITDGAGITYWQCHNGTDYINVTAEQSGLALYDEAMVWKLSEDANLNWSSLQNYPAACPGSSAITQLGDSTTCSDLWLDSAGDNATGNLTMGGATVIIFQTNSTARVCSESNAGAIYYNNVTNKHYGCNVTDWQELY